MNREELAIHALRCERARFIEDSQTLRRIAVDAVRVAKEGGPRVVCPSIGIVRGVIERGAFDGRSGFWSRIPHAMVRGWLWGAERELRRRCPDRPGWNDYHMARWFVTGSFETAGELFRRATSYPPLTLGRDRVLTYITARWMVSSVREVHDDFNLQLARLESLNGISRIEPLTASEIAAMMARYEDGDTAFLARESGASYRSV